MLAPPSHKNTENIMSDDMHNDPISTLVGKQSRVYQTGDMLTEDFIPDRVNIELTGSGSIVRIWMG